VPSAKVLRCQGAGECGQRRKGMSKCRAWPRVKDRRGITGELLIRNGNEMATYDLRRDRIPAVDPPMNQKGCMLGKQVANGTSRLVAMPGS
jgi:hypothetical protein